MFLSGFCSYQAHIFMFKLKLLNKVEICVLFLFVLINQARVCELLHETNDLKKKKKKET